MWARIEVWSMEERKCLKIPDVMTRISTAVDLHKHPGVHRLPIEHSSGLLDWADYL
jgi:hypothetical protein